jgi:hypothetical protein
MKSRGHAQDRAVFTAGAFTMCCCSRCPSGHRQPMSQAAACQGPVALLQRHGVDTLPGFTRRQAPQHRCWWQHHTNPHMARHMLVPPPARHMGSRWQAQKHSFPSHIQTSQGPTTHDMRGRALTTMGAVARHCVAQMPPNLETVARHCVAQMPPSLETAGRHCVAEMPPRPGTAGQDDTHQSR